MPKNWNETIQEMFAKPSAESPEEAANRMVKAAMPESLGIAEAAKDFQEDRELPDGDYTLTDDRAWFTAGMFSVRIKKTSEGVEVDVYPVGKEDDDSIASCCAFASDVR
jgi:hypothetical protein